MPRVHTGALALFYQERGSGEPLLLLPGLGTDHTAWGYQTLVLQQRFCCISVDNRDAGRSERAKEAYTIREMAQDMAGLMDALDLQQAHILGWSMGSAIAQELALAYPDRVRSLGLVATYHDGDPRAAERFSALAEVRRTMGLEVFLRCAYPWSFTYRAYQRPDFIENLQKQALANEYGQDQEAYERQVKATLGHYTKGRLGRIKCPTLVLVGDEDVLTPLERFARPIAQEIPNARLQVIPEVGHGLLWEQPDAVIQALEQFYDSLTT